MDLFDENAINMVNSINPLAVQMNAQKSEGMPDFWLAFRAKNYWLRLSLGHCLSEV